MATFQQLVAAKQTKQISREERLKSIDGAVKQIEKQFGKGTIGTLSDEFKVYPHVPSGIMEFDLATGIGGLPRGRIVEFFGAESSSKTTGALAIAAMAQQLGGFAALIDAEHAYDPTWGAKLGINNEEFLVSQPDNGEQALEILESTIKTNSFDVIIVDSVAALVPRAELEGDMGQSHMGLQARLMSQAMRKLTAAVAQSNTVVIFINQMRESMDQYIPSVTPGGLALKFYASLRIQFYRKEVLKKGDQSIGVKIRIKIIKNKVAAPFKEAMYDLYFDRGIDFEGSIITSGIKYEVIQRAGAYYRYDGQNMQGQEKMIDYLKSNPDKLAILREQILKAFAEKPSADQERAERKPTEEVKVEETVEEETNE